MTMFQTLWPRATKNLGRLHSQIVEVVMLILNLRKAEGATTGFMMRWIEDYRPEMAAEINRRGPKPESERIQHFKTLLGHALDELDGLGRVHCDDVGKRMMRGDVRSAPVWRTADDWDALEAHCIWMLKRTSTPSPRPYAERQRRLFESQITQAYKR